MDWQPIETAPESIRVLCHFPGSKLAGRPRHGFVKYCTGRDDGFCFGGIQATYWLPADCQPSAPPPQGGVAAGSY